MTQNQTRSKKPSQEPQLKSRCSEAIIRLQRQVELLRQKDTRRARSLSNFGEIELERLDKLKPDVTRRITQRTLLKAIITDNLDELLKCRDCMGLSPPTGEECVNFQRHADAIDWCQLDCTEQTERLWCVGLPFFLDGVVMVEKSGTSVLVVKAQCINLPLQERKLMNNTWEVGAFPHDGTIDAMEKLVAEVAALQKGFLVEVDGKQTRPRCYLHSIVADTPQRKAILGYEGRLICSKCKCQDTYLFLFDSVGMPKRKGEERDIQICLGRTRGICPRISQSYYWFR
ncbi:hypothetical protein ADUPG1_006464 [Aduncisulcus paluster]|uniref:Nudix hydrolase domain-containing protein n=1 Tax=Aduncisulcus paluster TaxID=2918883 RepID=A0ABQ5KIC4_9EUKA|nr:hypothetical protein ADUPG1_006464 [Aduncisulcus paluster]